MWPLLKPGGRLVYSTCSIFKEENEKQVADFVAHQHDCAELSIEDVQWGRPGACGRQILPGIDDMDGFFYACLEKTG